MRRDLGHQLLQVRSPDHQRAIGLSTDAKAGQEAGNNARGVPSAVAEKLASLSDAQEAGFGLAAWAAFVVWHALAVG